MRRVMEPRRTKTTRHTLSAACYQTHTSPLDLLISENLTHFEVCSYSQNSGKIKPSLAADMTDERKHLVLPLKCMMGTCCHWSTATE